MDASQLTKALGGIEMTRVSPPCVVSVLPVWLWRGVPSTHYRPGGRHCYYNNVSDGIIANLVMVPLSPQREKT